MPVQIRHINYVIAAADHGSFRRAAAALGVQESAISRRIRELEDRLGTAFFIRSPSGVMLTHAGKQFVQRGRKAILEIGLAKAEATAIGRGEDGHVRIGIFSSLASGFLSDLIESFGARHAAVKLTFIDGNPADHVAAIRKHQLDVAFITGAADWPGCDGLQLWTERIYVVLPTGHRLGGDGEVDFTELAGELLNGEIFYTLKEARIVIERWRHHYNTVRPHSSLGYKPPAPEVLQWPAARPGPASPATPAIAPRPTMN